MNACQKGKRGERAWRDELRANGYDAERYGQQGAGGSHEAPDVSCPQLNRFHFEVKFVETLSVPAAMRQAINDAGPKFPVVAHKTSRRPWLVYMPAPVFFAMLRGDHEAAVSDALNKVEHLGEDIEAAQLAQKTAQ